MKREVDIFKLMKRLPLNHLAGVPLEFTASSMKFTISPEIRRDRLTLKNLGSPTNASEVTFLEGDLDWYGVQLVRTVSGFKIVLHLYDE